MKPQTGWAATAGVIAAGAGYQYLIYRAAHDGLPLAVGLVLKALPLAFFAWWVWARATRKALGFAFLLAACGVVFWTGEHDYGRAAYGIPHAAVYLSLAWLFGHTLLPGHVPLITVLARRVHGELKPEIVRHTRYVTFAWALFCVGQVVLSALLYVFASVDLWALFITALNIPLLGLMFVAEYVVRVLRFPDHPQASISEAIRAFNAHTREEETRALSPETLSRDPQLGGSA